MNFLNPGALGTFGKTVFGTGFPPGGPSRIDSVDDCPVRKVTMPIDRIKGPGGCDPGTSKTLLPPLRRTIRLPWAEPLCLGSTPPATNLNPSAESSAQFGPKADRAVGSNSLGPGVLTTKTLSPTIWPLAILDEGIDCLFGFAIAKFDNARNQIAYETNRLGYFTV